MAAEVRLRHDTLFALSAGAEQSMLSWLPEQLIIRIQENHLIHVLLGYRRRHWTNSSWMATSNAVEYAIKVNDVVSEFTRNPTSDVYFLDAVAARFFLLVTTSIEDLRALVVQGFMESDSSYSRRLHVLLYVERYAVRLVTRCRSMSAFVAVCRSSEYVIRFNPYDYFPDMQDWQHHRFNPLPSLCANLDTPEELTFTVIDGFFSQAERYKVEWCLDTIVSFCRIIEPVSHGTRKYRVAKNVIAYLCRYAGPVTTKIVYQIVTKLVDSRNYDLARSYIMKFLESEKEYVDAMYIRAPYNPDVTHLQFVLSLDLMDWNKTDDIGLLHGMCLNAASFGYLSHLELVMPLFAKHYNGDPNWYIEIMRSANNFDRRDCIDYLHKTYGLPLLS